MRYYPRTACWLSQSRLLQFQRGPQHAPSFQPLRVFLHSFKLISAFFLVALAIFGQAPTATTPAEILFTNVRVFDGRSASLSALTSVLIRGNTIAAIGASAQSSNAKVIDGAGRTLMPGLIDAHAHMMFNSLSQFAIMSSDIGFVNLASGKAATAMLLRGYTSVRDLGGPSFGLKKALDLGMVAGPRIWPSGAMISQSGGHGDFRLPNELPAPPDSFAYSERVGAAEIADDPGTVRRRVREQLALGAS